MSEHAENTPIEDSIQIGDLTIRHMPDSHPDAPWRAYTTSGKCAAWCNNRDELIAWAKRRHDFLTKWEEST